MNNSLDEKIYKTRMYKKLKELFINNKYDSFLKEANKYLEEYPSDINTRFMRAKVLRSNKLFEEAISDLKYILNIQIDVYALDELFFTYYYLNKYSEALELLPVLYSYGNIKQSSLRIIELIMKKQLGIEMPIVMVDKCEYIKSQVLDYSSQSAIKHILEHKTDNEDNEYVTSYFKENINIEYLFKTIRENIKKCEKLNACETLDVYILSVSNVGYDKNNVCNYVKVVVIPNTDHIVTMYPIDNISNDCINNIDIDYDQIYKKKLKVKSISQIDKFNKRYKRV